MKAALAVVVAATPAFEAVVNIPALRLGTLDMAIANLLGSSLFDIAILAGDDLFYSGGSLLAHPEASHTLIAFTAVMMSALAIAGFIYRPQVRAVFGLT
ncbi:MAG: hypothetical protein HY846_03675 [Nitrosomonadales bacterium]|nr:hypothetical protein [Nitrosomonadales bacterium]